MYGNYTPPPAPTEDQALEFIIGALRAKVTTNTRFICLLSGIATFAPIQRSPKITRITPHALKTIVSQALHPVLHRITLSGDDFRRAAEMIACHRTLADSGTQIIWGCMQEREFSAGCRPVWLTRQLHGEQTVVFFFYHRIALATALF
jgi:hypothetical protein